MSDAACTMQYVSRTAHCVSSSMCYFSHTMCHVSKTYFRVIFSKKNSLNIYFNTILKQKNCPYPKITSLFISHKLLSLVQLMLENGMRTVVCQCLQVCDRDCRASEVKCVMMGYCENFFIAPMNFETANKNCPYPQIVELL